MTLQKLRLLTGVTLCAFYTGGIAHGQEATTVNDDTGARKLSTVTVTAQRREESIQDVPVSVTAADAELLADMRVGNIENISLLSPSVSFRQTNFAASSSNIQIRGIGTTGNARTFEGAVGVFIDGVYRTRSGQALSNFLDVDNLQILRGPQGTLFGKNTAAGALLVSSATPTTDETEGYLEASYATYDAVSLKGAVNIPVSETVAFRIAGIHVEQDGFIEDPNGGTLNNIKRDGVKAQLLWDASPDLTFRIIGDYAKQDDNCCYGTVDAIEGPLQGFIDSLSLGNGLKPPSHSISDFEAVTSPDTPNNVEDYGVTLLVDYDVAGGTLQSVTALRKYDVVQTQDADFSGAELMDLDETFKSSFFSQEFTFSGSVDNSVNADYVFGLYFSDEDLAMGRDLRWGTDAQTYWDVAFGVPGLADASPGLLSQERMKGTSESLAVFTHWDFSLNDKWNLILGARYSDDKKTGRFTNPYFHSPLDPLVLAGVMPGTEYDQSFSDQAVTGTISVQYHPNSDVMMYASYNRGYKSGGINLDVNAAGVPAATADPSFAAETIDAYEMGAKIDWMDGAARTNIAVFYNDITDLQVAQFLGLQFAIVNSPSAEVRGAEVEQTFALNDYFTLNGALTWLETAEFGVDPVLGIPDPTRPDLGGLSGRQFPTAPELAGNLSLSGNIPVAEGIALTTLTQIQYTDDVFTNSGNNLTQDAVTLLNFNIGLAFEKHDLTITAFARNLTDETYIASHFNTPLQDIDRNAYMGEPQTYGIMLRKLF